MLGQERTYSAIQQNLEARFEESSIGTAANSRSKEINVGDWNSLASSLSPVEHYEKERETIESLHTFQKLEKQYQFALNYSDSTLQNRRSHSYAVKSVAEKIGKCLGLNNSSCALAGVIGLAHDIGHAPFSHWGEAVLKRKLSPLGINWNHDYSGLLILSDRTGSQHQISDETLEGLLKRDSRFVEFDYPNRNGRLIEELPRAFRQEEVIKKLRLKQYNHLEGQIAHYADPIAFNASDIQDALRIGRLTPKSLEEYFPSAYQVYLYLLDLYVQEFKLVTGLTVSDEVVRSIIVEIPEVHGQVYERFADAFIDFQIIDLLIASTSNLNQIRQLRGLQTSSDLQNLDRLLLGFSTALRQEQIRFEKYCLECLFQHCKGAEQLFEKIYEGFLLQQIELPEPYRKKYRVCQTEECASLVVAEYMSRELNDLDLLDLASCHFPEMDVSEMFELEEVKYTTVSSSTAFRMIAARF